MDIESLLSLDVSYNTKNTSPLVRGVSTRRVLDFIKTGEYFSSNDSGMFYFWPLKSGFDSNNITPLKNFEREYDEGDVIEEAKLWARLHSIDDYFLDRFGINEDEFVIQQFKSNQKALSVYAATGYHKHDDYIERDLNDLEGCLIYFKPIIFELNVELETFKDGRLAFGDNKCNPYALFAPNGIECNYIQNILPLGKKDRELLS